MNLSSLLSSRNQISHPCRMKDGKDDLGIQQLLKFFHYQWFSDRINRSLSLLKRFSTWFQWDVMCDNLKIICLQFFIAPSNNLLILSKQLKHVIPFLCIERISYLYHSWIFVSPQVVRITFLDSLFLGHSSTKHSFIMIKDAL